MGETTRQFRYDLNSLDDSVEVINRFKGLNLIDRVPEDLWAEVHNIVWEAVTKTKPKKTLTKIYSTLMHGNNEELKCPFQLKPSTNTLTAITK